MRVVLFVLFLCAMGKRVRRVERELGMMDMAKGAASAATGGAIGGDDKKDKDKDKEKKESDDDDPIGAKIRFKNKIEDNYQSKVNASIRNLRKLKREYHIRSHFYARFD